MSSFASYRPKRKPEPLVLGPNGKPKVAIIIPAYNEAERIGRVLRAACGSKYANEIIVVGDGCTDNTAKVAAR